MNSKSLEYTLQIFLATYVTSTYDIHPLSSPTTLALLALTVLCVLRLTGYWEDGKDPTSKLNIETFQRMNSEPHLIPASPSTPLSTSSRFDNYVSSSCGDFQQDRTNNNTTFPSSDPTNPNNHLSTNRTFIDINFSLDASIGLDMLNLQSHKVLMGTTTIHDCLEDISLILRNCSSKSTHFCSLYDFRTYSLPGMTQSYALAKLLVKWLNIQGDILEDRIFAVAIVIPSGFNARLLKRLVEFVIWCAAAPLPPKIFEDDLDDAMEFLRIEGMAYRNGSLHRIKPYNGNKCTFLDPPSKDDVKREMEATKRKMEVVRMRSGSKEGRENSKKGSFSEIT